MHEILALLVKRRHELLAATLEHLWLSLFALCLAAAIAVPLALALARKRRLAEAVLQLSNIIQTIPSLALLGLLIPLVGIGSVPALIALTLYALLPILQNTWLGLRQIDPAIEEALRAFGLSRWQALWRVELPLALPAIISGVRISAVLIVGTATLAALIGAGGLGNIILLGIDRNNMALTFVGAALSALLAVAVSALICILQKSRRWRLPLLAALMVALAVTGAGQWPQMGRETVTIAGKLGSEPEILINMYRLLIEEENPGLRVRLKANFGKTSFLFNALQSGAIDIYPEFTGTVLETLVQAPPADTPRDAQTTHALGRHLLARQHGMAYLAPMRYQNTYALAVKADYAQAHHLAQLSDLARVQDNIRAGLTLEFGDRPDGYRGLNARGIRFRNLRNLEPALRYTALENGEVDLIDAYSTDSELVQYRLVVLADDLNLFPPYQGAPLMKSAFAARHPGIVRALERLAGKISAGDMQHMNYRVKAKGENPRTVAADYLRTHGLLQP